MENIKDWGYSRKFEESVLENIEKILLINVPTAKGQYLRAIRRLCQYLLGIKELSGLESIELEPILYEWHKRALPIIPNKNFDNTFMDFEGYWATVKYPLLLENTLGKAVEKAFKNQDILPETLKYDSKEAKLLTKVCWELSQLKRKNPFWIASRDAAGILGVSHTQANKFIRLLIARKTIQVVKKHTNLKARRLKYIGIGMNNK